MNKDELREKILAIDRSFEIDKNTVKDFLLPNYYLDRLVDFFAAQDIESRRKDLNFLGDMKQRLEKASTDITQYEYVEKMIDDWIDELFYNNLPTYAIDEKYLKRAKALITAKLQEVDRAARIDELERLKAIDAFNEAYTLDPRPSKIVTNRLASLKGGD